MKKLYTILLVLLVAGSLNSCSKDDITTTGTYSAKDFDKSLKVWAAYKTSVNNSYTYTTLRQSFSSNNSETQLTVINGEVTKRDYVNFQYDGASSTHDRIILKEWHETPANLGSHTDEGAAILTLDEVYDKAKNVWLKADTKTNDIFFEAKNNGILSTAGYTLKGCADDCFFGINITSVTAL
ncbi:hypothetical protein EWM62_02530 [Mucilaginibacter terrigena]|uniref:Lipoprotein n=1 Tax=Mucilaginibacter terrigena TaxID=2492395 RepID=A0A4Q5LS10_9SPHI|nr:hypothetical protein [Mucilaginibacter terrigena]RYU92331.1 hypothetical protein EWM62_02530 [Mucilaginibacter terrigena]